MRKKKKSSISKQVPAGSKKTVCLKVKRAKAQAWYFDTVFKSNEKNSNILWTQSPHLPKRVEVIEMLAEGN